MTILRLLDIEESRYSNLTTPNPRSPIAVGPILTEKLHGNVNRTILESCYAAGFPSKLFEPIIGYYVIHLSKDTVQTYEKLMNSLVYKESVMSKIQQIV
jgi:hypothetical protein